MSIETGGNGLASFDSVTHSDSINFRCDTYY